MSNNKEKIAFFIILATLLVTAIVLVVLLNKPSSNDFGIVNTGNYDTVTVGVTHATTTVNTTSTQLVNFAPNSTSTTKWASIENISTSTLTCSLDDRGTTAASSSVGANKGIVLPPLASSSVESTLTVGQCSPGSVNCFPFMGTVNCLSSAVGVVAVTKK